MKSTIVAAALRHNQSWKIQMGNVLKSIALAGALSISGVALASADCVVDDPTGTSLNVRSEPNGEIRGALHNGATVRVRDSQEDDNGKTWVYVIPDEGKKGWVYRNFISCGMIP